MRRPDETSAPPDTSIESAGESRRFHPISAERSDPKMASEHSLDTAINALIDELLALGCEVVAIGRGYCISEPEGMEPIVKRALDGFGPRDHLMPLFNAILRERGLSIDI